MTHLPSCSPVYGSPIHGPLTLLTHLAPHSTAISYRCASDPQQQKPQTSSHSCSCPPPPTSKLLLPARLSSRQVLCLPNQHRSLLFLNSTPPHSLVSDCPLVHPPKAYPKHILSTKTRTQKSLLAISHCTALHPSPAQTSRSVCTPKSNRTNFAHN